MPKTTEEATWDRYRGIKTELEKYGVNVMGYNAGDKSVEITFEDAEQLGYEEVMSLLDRTIRKREAR